MTTTLWFRLSASSSLVAVLCSSNVSFPSNETNPIGRCCRATKDNAGPPATTHSFPGNADEASARQLDAIPAAISGVTVDVEYLPAFCRTARSRFPWIPHFYLRSVLYGASLDSFSSSLIVGDSRSFYQATNYGELEKAMFTWNSDTDGSLRNFLSDGIIRFNWNWLKCLFEVSKQRDSERHSFLS